MNRILELMIISILSNTVLPISDSISYEYPDEDSNEGTNEHSGIEWIDTGSDTLYNTDNTQATWNEAVEKCKMRGNNGRLATFDSESSLIRLHRYAKGLRGIYWIGIYRNSSGVFESVGSVQSIYFNWAPGEPNNYNKEDCVELYMSALDYNDKDCGNKIRYLCASDKGNGTGSVDSKSAPSLPVTGTTDSTTDWIDIGTDTLYSIEYTLATWNHAIDNCKLKGINGRLATVDSSFVTNRLQTHFTNIGSRLWIGIRKGPSGAFVRTGNVPISFFNWNVGEPNDLGEEDCVELHSWSMKWNDMPCSGKRFYLCASDKVQSSTTFSVISDPNVSSTSNSGTALNSELKSAPLLTLTDIAKECHATVIAISFLIVSLFLVSLVVLILKRWPLPRKDFSLDTRALL